MENGERRTETIQLRTQQQLIASAYSNQRMLTRHIRDTINQLVYIEHTKKMKTSQNTHSHSLHWHIFIYTYIYKHIQRLQNLYLKQISIYKLNESRQMI